MHTYIHTYLTLPYLTLPCLALPYLTLPLPLPLPLPYHTIPFIYTHTYIYIYVCVFYCSIMFYITILCIHIYIYELQYVYAYLLYRGVAFSSFLSNSRILHTSKKRQNGGRRAQGFVLGLVIVDRRTEDGQGGPLRSRRRRRGGMERRLIPLQRTRTYAEYPMAYT